MKIREGGPQYDASHCVVFFLIAILLCGGALFLYPCLHNRHERAVECGRLEELDCGHAPARVRFYPSVCYRNRIISLAILGGVDDMPSGRILRTLCRMSVRGREGRSAFGQHMDAACWLRIRSAISEAYRSGIRGVAGNGRNSTGWCNSNCNLRICHNSLIPDLIYFHFARPLPFWQLAIERFEMVLCVVLAIGLWKLREWARVISELVSFLAPLSALPALYRPSTHKAFILAIEISSLVYAFWSIWYLRRADVIHAFEMSECRALSVDSNPTSAPRLTISNPGYRRGVARVRVR